MPDILTVKRFKYLLIVFFIISALAISLFTHTASAETKTPQQLLIELLTLKLHALQQQFYLLAGTTTTNLSNPGSSSFAGDLSIPYISINSDAWNTKTNVRDQITFDISNTSASETQVHYKIALKNTNPAIFDTTYISGTTSVPAHGTQRVNKFLVVNNLSTNGSYLATVMVDDFNKFIETNESNNSNSIGITTVSGLVDNNQKTGNYRGSLSNLLILSNITTQFGPWDISRDAINQVSFDLENASSSDETIWYRIIVQDVDSGEIKQEIYGSKLVPKNSTVTSTANILASKVDKGNYKATFDSFNRYRIIKNTAKTNSLNFRTNTNYLDNLEIVDLKINGSDNPAVLDPTATANVTWVNRNVGKCILTINHVPDSTGNYHTNTLGVSASGTRMIDVTVANPFGALFSVGVECTKKDGTKLSDVIKVKLPETLGTYTRYSGTRLTEQKNNINEYKALALCKAVDLMIAVDMKCEWNGRVIYTAAAGNPLDNRSIVWGDSIKLIPPDGASSSGTYPRLVKVETGKNAGDLLLFYESGFYGGSIWMYRSHDGGHTWITPVVVSPRSGVWVYASCNVIQLSDGRLMMTTQRRNRTSGFIKDFYIDVKYSSDGGETWTDSVTVFNGGNWEGRPFQAPHDANGDGVNDIYIYFTEIITPTNIPADLVKTSDSNGVGVAYIVSYDNGVTWINPSKERYSAKIIHRDYAEGDGVSSTSKSAAGMVTMFMLSNDRVAFMAEEVGRANTPYLIASDPADWDWNSPTFKGPWTSADYLGINDNKVYPNNGKNAWQVAPDQLAYAPYATNLADGSVIATAISNKFIQVWLGNNNGRNFAIQNKPFPTASGVFSFIEPISDNDIIVGAGPGGGPDAFINLRLGKIVNN